MKKMVLASVVLAACHASVVNEPTHATSTADKGALYQQAVIAMGDVGLTPETKDADAGVVVSEWICPGGSDCAARYRIRVTVSDGAYDVVVQCQERETVIIDNAPYVECSGNTIPDTQARQKTAIADALGGVR